MVRKMGVGLAALTVLATLQVGNVAKGQEITVQIENLQPTGGLAFTPFWLGVHDNSFEVFDAGSPASTYDGITQIAELGDTSAITARFDSEIPGGVQTTFQEPNGPPVFSPGESASVNLNVLDSTANRYLSFASMVVPSNDLFVGNDDALELFDAGGNFIGPVIVNLFGNSVYDNGSEINDINDGPAFVQGQDATAGGLQNGNVTSFFSDVNADDYIASIVGVTTAPGDVITTPFGCERSNRSYHDHTRAWDGHAYSDRDGCKFASSPMTRGMMSSNG